MAIELHIFCDASQIAYGCCAYLRCHYDNELISSRLIASKGKVCPLKEITLPKLELSAAVLATQLGMQIQKALKITPQYTTYWTDSSIVLAWLNKQTSKLEIFVANRVQQILKVSKVNQWRHVKTDQNPADVVSRGALPATLEQNKKWWHGPDWLTMPNKEWPSSQFDIKN